MQIFLVIGAQKAGSTALFNYLEMHPDVVGSKQKEVRFFNREGNYEQGIDFYKSHFPQVDREVFFIDSSPGYLNNPDAAARIFKFDRKIKMIVLLRDPVDRAFSAWNMYREYYRKNRNWFIEGWLNSVSNDKYDYIFRTDSEIEDLELFIRCEIKAMRSGSGRPIEAPVLSHGLYAINLERYYKLFDRDQLLILENKQLRSCPKNTLRKIENFIGLAEHNWNEDQLLPIFEGNYTEPLPDAACKLLSDFYAPHNEALYSLIGQNFSWK